MLYIPCLLLWLNFFWLFRYDMWTDYKRAATKVITSRELSQPANFTSSPPKVNTNFFPVTQLSQLHFLPSHITCLLLCYITTPHIDKHGHFSHTRTCARVYYPSGNFFQWSLCSNLEYLWITCAILSDFCNLFPACFIFTPFATL